MQQTNHKNEYATWDFYDVSEDPNDLLGVFE